MAIPKKRLTEEFDLETLKYNNKGKLKQFMRIQINALKAITLRPILYRPEFRASYQQEQRSPYCLRRFSLPFHKGGVPLLRLLVFL